MSGWIKIYRNLQDHWIWQDANKLKWWLDIILMANHKDSKFLLGNELFEVKRGEFHTSEVKLSERWSIDRKTVRRFLELLEKDHMVTITKSKKGTTIKVNNYNAFQDVSNSSVDNQEDNEGDNEVPDVSQISPNEVPDKSQISPNKGDTNKNVKNVKECIKNVEEEQVKQLVEQFEKCFNRMVIPKYIDILKSFLDEGLELELVLKAMELSIGKDDPLAYCKKILVKSMENKVHTVHEFDLKSQEHELLKSRKVIQVKSKNAAFTTTYSHNWNLEELEQRERQYLEEKYI